MTCDEKWILHNNPPWPAQWLAQEEAPKHFPKPNLHQKRSWSLFGSLLPVWSTTVFWILVKPLYLRVFSANQWDALKTARSAVSISQQKGPNSSPWQRWTAGHTTNASKVEWIGLQSFASSTIFIWPLDNRLPLLQAFQQLFAEKMLPQPAGGRKCLPRVHRILKHGFLHLFLTGKNVLIVMISILINKDVLSLVIMI